MSDPRGGRKKSKTREKREATTTSAASDAASTVAAAAAAAARGSQDSSPVRQPRVARTRAASDAASAVAAAAAAAARGSQDSSPVRRLRVSRTAAAAASDAAAAAAAAAATHTYRVQDQTYEMQYSEPLEYQDAQMNKRSERVGVMHNSDRVTVGEQEVMSVMSGERPAVVVPVTLNSTGETFRLVTAHAPYQSASGIATSYAAALREKAEQEGVDMIMGDLNLYSQQTRSRARNVPHRGHYKHVPTGGSSQSGAPLDQVHVSKELADRVTARDVDLAKSPNDASEATLTVASWNLQGQGALGPEQLAGHSANQHWDVLLAQEPSAFGRKRRREPERRSTRSKRPRGSEQDNPSDHKPIAVEIKQADEDEADGDS